MRDKLRTWFYYFHEKHIYTKKLSFIHWFFDLKPDKYCWADCVSWAYSPNRFNPFMIESTDGCKQDSKDNGMCYCGGWSNGICWHTLSKEEQELIRKKQSNSQDIKPF